MNKNIIAVIGGIVAIVVLGWLISRSSNTIIESPNATSTPVGSGNTDSVDPGPTAGVATVTTSSSVTPSDTTAVVKGSVVPNGAFTNYWYEYGTTDKLGSKIAGQSIGSGYTSISAPAYITGLTKDTTYYFSLVAENKYGKSVGSTYSFQTTHGSPAPVGSAPKATTVAASGISKGTVNLNGKVNPNNSTTWYWFEYGKTTDLGQTSSLVSLGSGLDLLTPSISLSELDPGTTYYFRINAQNQFGTVNGSILSFKTK